MSRWFEVALTLVLFTAVMLLARWGLHAWLPTLNSTLDGMVGRAGTWTVVIAVLACAGFIGFWQRTPDGRLRPLLPPRRG